MNYAGNAAPPVEELDEQRPICPVLIVIERRRRKLIYLDAILAPQVSVDPERREPVA